MISHTTTIQELESILIAHKVNSVQITRLPNIGWLITINDEETVDLSLAKAFYKAIRKL